MTNKHESVKAPQVFICHSKQDIKEAEELFDQLNDAGAEPWLDKKKLVLGDDWEYEIKEAVAKSDAFVVCLRPGFDRVGFRQKEVKWAIEAWRLRPPGQGFIIPFIIEPCELPVWCQPFHAGSDLSVRTKVDDVLIALEKHCEWGPKNKKSFTCTTTQKVTPPETELMRRIQQLFEEESLASSSSRKARLREMRHDAEEELGRRSQKYSNGE